jgi:simple sugar transport system ATP-binding protein
MTGAASGHLEHVEESAEDGADDTAPEDEAR